MNKSHQTPAVYFNGENPADLKMIQQLESAKVVFRHIDLSRCKCCKEVFTDLVTAIGQDAQNVVSKASTFYPNFLHRFEQVDAPTDAWYAEMFTYYPSLLKSPLVLVEGQVHLVADSEDLNRLLPLN
ncbi:hypothetical protein [Persicobacter psychrovividus]|uniref:Thioredoxin-like fold domain-containing protein n=1 Tax=Persicobacter psychrovividus TaxID=387638 RepID=A0ABM7VKU6_9BACT|nr:hypothetical protein PEPS_38840 [Persicobacter psychrovividus]